MSPGSGWTVGEPLMLAGVAALGIGLLVIFVVLVGSRSDASQSPLAEQLALYGAKADRTAAASSTAPLATMRGLAATLLASNQSLEARISQRLEQAGLALRPPEWLMIHAGTALGAALLGLLLGGGSPGATAFFLLLGTAGPWVYLAVRRSRRTSAFAAQLADTLQLLSGSLSAGLSLAQSLDTIVREGAEPVSGEFKRAVVDTRLGVSLEDALEGVARRMDSKDFGWVVMAVRIQREVGGNLAELLLSVAATLREREYLRRHVSALSAEGRLSCWILGGLAPAFFAYLLLTKPDYVRPMYTTPLGVLLLVGSAVLLGVGVLWMSKAAKVEV